MKFGLALPYNQTRSIPRWARLAEEAGWDGVFLGDAIWTEDPMIALAAAAMTTTRIRLGTMLVPAPLRHPWKIAGESLALDLLSEGRLILGLGTGATWMGWYAFPDVETRTGVRAELLEETIDILTLLCIRRPFDYIGKHYNLRLSQLNEMYYPPQPVQQPRVPIWAPLIWPLKNSKRWIQKCDGLFAEKWGAEGPEQVTPDDIRAMKAFIDADREPDAAFDIVVSGKTGALEPSAQAESLQIWQESGATWWVEEMFGSEAADVLERIRQGPPRL